MSLRPQIRKFWQHRRWGNYLLLPLSGLYWLLWHARQLLAQQATRSLPVPVIIAGGITAGGGGKTTLVAALVTGLREHNLTPGVIARGYGRRRPDIVLATATTHTPAELGDEAAMLYHSLAVPVCVGTERYQVAQTLLAAHPEIDVIISDDGLQHVALPRDFEIIVNSAYGHGNGWLLPAGPLREPATRLATVDALVRKGAPVPAGEYALTLGTPTLLANNQEIEFAALAKKNICAIAGIAEPASFFAELRHAGISLNQTKVFADHHNYTATDLAQIDADWIIMTAKDAIKCNQFKDRRIIEFRSSPTLDPVLLAKIVTRVRRSSSP